jgi:hypothetical protein
LQISAYKKPIENAEFAIDGMFDVANIKLAILQVGYRRNKAGYKWNEIEDKFLLFLAGRQIWANETEGQEPKRRDYPLVLSPAATKAAVDENQDALPPVRGKKIKRTKSFNI